MSRAGATPTDATEAAVLGAVSSLVSELGSQDAERRVSLDASLDRELGLGSLERVELLVRIETACGVRLPETGIQTAETPADWVRTVREAESVPSGNDRSPIVQPSRDAYPPPATALTLAEVLHRQVERDPGRVHIHLLDQEKGQAISHAQLLEGATRVASGLLASGLRRNETVAIMLPTCEDFFSSFLGVVLAGGVAVPVYPPARANQLEGYVQRQSLILRNARVRFLISFDRIRPIANAVAAELPSLKEGLSTAELVDRGRGQTARWVDPAELCFIQYTSGSTGDPKGVALSHHNVLSNIRGIGHAVEVVPSDKVVSWLPLYHDMGLIGSWLFSLYHGLPITVLSPLDFLIRPERWLWALSDSAGSLCPAPNFAFELCVRKVTDEVMEGVDLSKWRVAINAGEPVLAATLRRFTERFGPWGFDSRAYMPFYGLAESSVALTYPPFWRGPVIDRIDRESFEGQGRAVPLNEREPGPALEFVANGIPLPDHEVRVVDDDGRDVPDRIRGRIVFRGPSRTAGYFRNPEATAEVMDADGWLDSGDLGYLIDGELYVTGRLKDCIIKGGRNIIPQDVEMAAWEAQGVRKGCVAAFGSVDAESGTERLVVVAETRATARAALAGIRDGIAEAVTNSLGIPPDDIVLVGPGSVPKTSSGKIQRRETCRRYEAGVVASHAAAAPWLQIAKLWLRGTAYAAAESSWAFGRKALCAVPRSLGVGVALVGGMVARVAPAPAATRLVVSSASWVVASLSGPRPLGRIGGNGPCIMLVNRSHRLDPLHVAAATRSAFVFADRTAFREMGWASAFLLDPLVAESTQNGRPSPEGPLVHDMQAALVSGLSVVSFADSPIGEPPARTRFRAEGFVAADRTGLHAVPVLLRRNGDGATLAVEGAPLQGPDSYRDRAAGRQAVREFLEAALANGKV